MGRLYLFFRKNVSYIFKIAVSSSGIESQDFCNYTIDLHIGEGGC